MYVAVAGNESGRAGSAFRNKEHLVRETAELGRKNLKRL